MTLGPDPQNIPAPPAGQAATAPSWAPAPGAAPQSETAATAASAPPAPVPASPASSPAVGPSQLIGGGLKNVAVVDGGAGQVVTPHSQLWWALWRVEVIASVLVLFSSQIQAWAHPFGSTQADFIVSQTLSGLALIGLVLSQILNPSPPNARP